jgi:hypothetical protein
LKKHLKEVVTLRRQMKERGEKVAVKGGKSGRAEESIPKGMREFRRRRRVNRR